MKESSPTPSATAVVASGDGGNVAATGARAGNAAGGGDGKRGTSIMRERGDRVEWHDASNSKLRDSQL